MKPSDVKINGVSIRPGYLGVARGRKYLDTDGGWTLATRRGMVIAKFTSEAKLEDWWHAFQTSQGRVPIRLATGKPPARSKGGRSGGSRIPTLPSSFEGSSLRDWDFD
jgi:hypothetical protein